MQPQFAVESLLLQSICIPGIHQSFSWRFDRLFLVNKINQTVCFLVPICLIIRKLLGFFFGLHDVYVARNLLAWLSVYQRGIRNRYWRMRYSQPQSAGRWHFLLRPRKNGDEGIDWTPLVSIYPLHSILSVPRIVHGWRVLSGSWRMGIKALWRSLSNLSASLECPLGISEISPYRIS